MSLHRQSKGKLGEPLREEVPGSSEKETDPTKSGVGGKSASTQRRHEADVAAHWLQVSEMAVSVGAHPPLSRRNWDQTQGQFLVLDRAMWCGSRRGQD